MPGNPLKSLQEKISAIESDPFARPRCPHVRLSKVSFPDPSTGSLKGEIEVFLEKEGGKEETLWTESLDGVATEEEAEDRLSEAISRALMVIPR